MLVEVLVVVAVPRPRVVLLDGRKSLQTDQVRLAAHVAEN